MDNDSLVGILITLICIVISRILPGMNRKLILTFYNLIPLPRLNGGETFAHLWSSQQFLDNGANFPHLSNLHHTYTLTPYRFWG